MFFKRLWLWVWPAASAVSVRWKVIGIVILSQLVLGLTLAWWVHDGLGQWLSYLLDEERVAQAMDAGVRGIIVVTLLATLGGLLLAWMLTVALTGPLFELAALAGRVATGDLSSRSSVRVRDEIGHLAQSFNSMLDALAASRDSLVASNAELTRKNEDLRRLWEDLKNREETRVHLLARVVSAHEEERRRLSRELHDGAGQMLATALVHLKLLERTADPVQRQAKVAELREMIVQTLEEWRSLSMDLRPAVLDDLGLAGAIEWHARDLQRTTGIEVSISVDGTADDLAAPIEVELYRIAQETLTNVSKHAHAHHCMLQLAFSSRDVSLTVADDGIGFDPAAAPRLGSKHGLGLISMRERAELLGGSFSLESTPGLGTRVHISVPLLVEVAV